MHPAKIQISLRMREVWSEYSLGAYRIANDASFSMGTTKTDQIQRMRRLICVFIGRIFEKVHFLMLHLICFNGI